MSDDYRLKMRATLNECLLHAEILQQDLDELGDATFSADNLESSLAPATVRLLDQLAYRFAKLQDSLGEKMLPLLLLVAEEPMAPTTTFAEKLQRLERLGYIPSAEQWRVLREVRNQIAHEYPEHPEIKAAVLNRLLQSVRELLAFWGHLLPIADKMLAD